MSDDWSLKDNLYEDPDGLLTYHKRIIETLREKLIDDLIERLSNECGTCGQSVISIKEIKTIINKRFGVEE